MCLRKCLPVIVLSLAFAIASTSCGRFRTGIESVTPVPAAPTLLAPDTLHTPVALTPPTPSLAAVRTGTVAIITGREGSVFQVESSLLLYDNRSQLTNGVPMDAGLLMPFSQMKSIAVQGQYPYTLTITLNNGTVVSGLPEGYGRDLVGVTTADIPLTVNLQKVERIDFERLTETPNYSMANIVPVSGSPVAAPARSIQFGQFVRGLGAGRYWYDSLQLSSGLSIPLAEMKSLEVLQVETIPDEATSVTRREATIAVTLNDGTVRTEVVNAYAPCIRAATTVGPFDMGIQGIKKVVFEWRTEPATSWDARKRYIASGWSSDNIQKGREAGVTLTDTGELFKVTYDPKKDAYFQLFWQYPANNWGCKPKSDPEHLPGINLAGAKAIWVTAWGEKGGEIVSFGAGQNCSSFETTPVTVTLTTTPTRYLVATISAGNDLSDVASVFHFTVDAKGNPSPITFYIRDILVEGISRPDPRLQACSVAGSMVKPLPKNDRDGNLRVLEQKLSTLAWTSSDCDRANLQRLYNEGYRGIVTYGTGPEDNTPLVAREIGFEGVILGVWDPTNTNEVAAAIKLADYVDGFVVGNEVLLRKRQRLEAQSLSTQEKDDQLRDTLDQVRNAIDELRNVTGKPATTTEVVNDPLASEIIKIGDWYFPNAHPYYNCVWEPRSAVTWTVEQYKNAKVAAGGKRVSFKEVGLPPGDLDQWPCGTQPSPLTSESPGQYYQFLDQAHCQGQVDFVYFFFTPQFYEPRLCGS